jgi:MYXO-CTERM domain-containing protein
MPPVFDSTPTATVSIGHAWTYDLEVSDPGGDPFTLTIDDPMPDGMVWDEAGRSLTWTPGPEALAGGDPAGHYAFTIRAEDEDGGHSGQEVALTVTANQPPPTPPLLYPDGTESIAVVQPTVILENVDDPEGDPVQYFIDVDTDSTFTTADRQSSGALDEGAVATEWPLPLALEVPEGGSRTFYIRRWASDGQTDSEQVTSLFVVDLGGGGGDGDGDGDGDGGSTDDETGAGCACRAARTSDASTAWLGLTLVALVAGRRRRR